MSVELEGPSSIVYKHEKKGFIKDSTPAEKITISPAKWAAFRAALDQSRVWLWKREYRDPGVLDGTSWGLAVTYDDRKMKSLGVNAYPDKAAFERVQAAVTDLVGKPFH